MYSKDVIHCKKDKMSHNDFLELFPDKAIIKSFDLDEFVDVSLWIFVDIFPDSPVVPAFKQHR